MSQVNQTSSLKNKKTGFTQFGQNAVCSLTKKLYAFHGNLWAWKGAKALGLALDMKHVQAGVNIFILAWLVGSLRSFHIQVREAYI